MHPAGGSVAACGAPSGSVANVNDAWANLQAAAGRRFVVVDVRLLAVILDLVLGLVLVAVDDRRVIVAMTVIVRPVLELVDQAAAVPMRHVVVVMIVNGGGMRVLLLARFLALDALLRHGPFLSHGFRAPVDSRSNCA